MTDSQTDHQVHAPAPSTTFLFRVEARLGAMPPIVMPEAPLGARIIAAVSEGTVRGPRVNGTLIPGVSGDWVTVRVDRAWQLDVRAAFTTDDNADVFYYYTGIAKSLGEGRREIRGAPRFETSDERYRWLNDVQAVAIGETDQRTMTVYYDIHALD